MEIYQEPRILSMKSPVVIGMTFLGINEHLESSELMWMDTSSQDEPGRIMFACTIQRRTNSRFIVVTITQ